ncbi:sodium:solute symporter [Tenacibaculum finnmarkense genomovar finnmarkense]|uniref:sodium:solute symporter n=1 Tax=Tenacibaculum finnmarkense TaxID=2781243 RepID=UPI001E2C4051|nr:sodium:solute symporter [Tenacibaculum finnmarkense]MCD8418038.1 sodium:solute symporter [Tenacibaculum finnmarkense genomovar finnmarkense]MCG8202844.1 sodium:solute symporter [Tenacibaculum finnmarkense genomovar finnmarkense]MCG8210226.1 sodium:solute symporter [Tenacibaculum finnmarkense genomovar finnmarkense]MCG8213125.1 sodium:solute symporter [Tenacibaculum finnmarkense genomovar finnmarkense]MCG8225946.1 sodium:solute symporter [Tenacibaculum finnmarkense genomovar finnmarkense]
MQPLHILLLIIAYFGVLMLISYFTGKSANNATFFKADNSSPWYLVAFGMVGASLSGVTFISVPGWVEGQQMSYMQMVFGYVVGYAVIGLVLLPLYYRLNLTSIYTYLETRFGRYSYKTGASFFLLSRTIGAAFRLFLVANVLQLILFDAYGIPFWLTVTITILLIWLYTFKAGIKTIVWTDTLQTLFMLISVGICIIMIKDSLQIDSLFSYISESKLAKMFFFEDIKAGNYFWNRFLSGAFIAIVMTGLDQDMMQKNLTCRNLKDAQKNMFWFTIVLVIVNFFFLALGVLLTDYATINGLDAHKDQLFPMIAMSGNLGLVISLFFLLGLIAAAYSSADSALTSLTTSFSIDILEIDKKEDHQQQEKTRKKIHILFSFILIATILVFKYFIADASVIAKIFQFAGYTYGPLLGLYAFGLFTKLTIKDKFVPIICIASPILTFLISHFSKTQFNFDFGFFVLVLNGLLTFFGLLMIKTSK